jgi:hypothetical protein
MLSNPRPYQIQYTKVELSNEPAKHQKPTEAGTIVGKSYSTSAQSAYGILGYNPPTEDRQARSEASKN